MNGVTESSVTMDAMLEPLLLAGSDDDVHEYLSGLIKVHAERVIKKIIHYKLHLTSSDQRAEADDLYHEALVQLLGELSELRTRPDEHPISDVRGIAAIIAHRTCSRWMRRQFPERHALKNRLHYLLTRQRGLALWRDENRMLVAGFAEWQREKRAVTTHRLRRLSEDQEMVIQIGLSKNCRPQELGDALAKVFNFLGSPVEFDDLVSVFASMLGIRDQPHTSTDETENGIALRAASEEPDPARRVEKRLFLQRLWEELQQLPINQRAALLLNLKDAEGRGCIELFPATGVATLRQLADALGMSADRFTQLWNELPIDDARIADQLQLTRQQVINARKSGRERLARRLKGFFELDANKPSPSSTYQIRSRADIQQLGKKAFDRAPYAE